MTLAYVLLPALISALVIAAARRSSWARHLIDHPNERSLHSVPTLRLGGLGVAAGALPLVALAGSAPLAAIAACAAFLAIVSLIDDVRSLPIEVRLPAHIVAAIVAVLAFAAPVGGGNSWGAVEGALVVVAIAWMANLFNFMDGSDGLAGGMAVIGFAAFAIAAADAGSMPLALAATAISSAALGFLLHNFPPARVFLGDSGSIPLGFLAGALGAWGALLGAWPAWFPVLVFSPFIVDATLTLMRRLIAGERIWRAHRSHCYQRLVLAGWSRRRLAVAAYALMAAVGASALAARGEGAQVQCAIILVWVAIYASLLVAVERRTREHHAVS
jgi:UDP-N-acetylmuramyl pentapeptide phosphotransferase/UDP-N-acetylglucosamine-1-phosphate transferase